MHSIPLFLSHTLVAFKFIISLIKNEISFTYFKECSLYPFTFFKFLVVFPG